MNQDAAHEMRPDRPEPVPAPKGLLLSDTRGRPLRDLRISVTDRCNFRCTYCMPKEVFGKDFQFLERSQLLSFGEIHRLVRIFRDHGVEKIRITGGEPLMHDCTPLTTQLHQAGFATHIETSGSSPLSGDWDWITLSPKKFKDPLPEILPLAGELKIIIYNKSDFDWAEQWARLVSPACRLYLQPEWSRSTTVTPLIIEYIKENPQWRFSLQLHKYIHVP